MPRCHIRLLGDLVVEVDGSPMPRLSTRKSAELLALLAVKFGSWRSREEISQYLWPTSEPELARTSLRQALTKLREALSPFDDHFLQSDKVSVRLNPETCTCDFADFQTLNKRATAVEGEESVTTLQAAIQLGESELAPSIRTEWIEPIRLDHSERCLNLREALVEELGRLDRWHEALTEAEAAILADPLRESLTLAAMRCSAKCGERNRGIVAFRKLERRCVAELGMPPSEAVRVAAAKLRRIKQDTPQVEVPRSIENSVVTQPWETIGRSRAIEAVCELLRPNSCITITGLGGMGKSQLAREVLLRFLKDSKVPLLAVIPGKDLEQDLSNATGVEGEALTLESIVSQLPANTTLFLDGVEDCSGQFEQLAIVVRSSNKEIALLATSRIPPSSDVSTEFHLGPLEIDEARRLFLSATARIQAGRPVTVSETQADQVCHAVDCIPLAILVAAGQTKVQTPEEIADGLRQNPTIPALERSIEWSLQHLGDDRRVIEALAVHEGWTFATMSALSLSNDAFSTMENLLASGLVSIVNEVPARRFEFLLTARQVLLASIGKERLSEVRLSHATFFETMASDLVEQYFAGNQAGSGASFEHESENISAAIEYLIQTDNARAAKMATNCAPFWFALRQSPAAEKLFDQILAGDLHALSQSELGLLKQRAAINCGRHGNYGTALSLLREARQLYADAQDRIRFAEALNSTGNIHLYLGGGLQDAEACFQQALEVFKEESSSRGTAMVLGNLGKTLRLQARFQEASECLTQALAMNRAARHQHWEVSNLSELGEIALRQGRFELARERLAEAEKLSATLQGSSILDIHVSQAELAFRLQDEQAGRAKALEALRTCRNTQAVSYLPEVLRASVYALAEAGDHNAASRVAGIEESYRAIHGLSLAGEPAERYGNVLTALSARFADFHEQFQIGTSWSLNSGLDWLETRLEQPLYSNLPKQKKASQRP